MTDTVIDIFPVCKNPSGVAVSPRGQPHICRGEPVRRSNRTNTRGSRFRVSKQDEIRESQRFVSESRGMPADRLWTDGRGQVSIGTVALVLAG